MHALNLHAHAGIQAQTAILILVPYFFSKFRHVKNQVYQGNMQKDYFINIFYYEGHP
jgi:hypothetical protein